MEVVVIVIVSVIVTVTVVSLVSPAADTVSASSLPHPCKEREAMKPKQMAANARASCMITKIDDVKYCQKQMRGSLFASAGIATARIVKSGQTKSKAVQIDLGCALLGVSSLECRHDMRRLATSD